MPAEIAPGYDQQRHRLAEIVPLSTPFTLFITPSQCCNFKCHYCSQSLSSEEKVQLGLKQQHLNYDTFLKIATQAAEFPDKFKRILLTGLGEPLMNRRIPEMVATLTKLGVAEKYEIFTNASLLSHDMSESLLAAGLTRLRISLQGLSSEKYMKTCGAQIDFGQFMENIQYFYEHRGNCRVYIKIIDSVLDSDDDRKEFYQMFRGISDEIFVEHLVRAQPSMGDYKDKADSCLTFYGEESKIRRVCPYIFYTLQTDALGNVFPCPPLGLPLNFSLGNVNEQTLHQIWNGSKLKNLRSSHLNYRRETLLICGTCVNYLCFTPEEDNLDNDAAAILQRI